MPITVPQPQTMVSAETFGQPVAQQVNLLLAPYVSTALVPSGFSISSQQSWVKHVGYDVIVLAKFILSNGTLASPSFSLPVPAATDCMRPFGQGAFLQNGVRWWGGLGIGDAANGIVSLTDSGGSFLNSTYPFAWKATDEIHMRMAYKSATPKLA